MSQRIDPPTRAVSKLASRPDLAEKARPGDDPRIGTLLAGRYQMLQRLGDGAMGAVYLAEHVALRRKVAVKVLHAELSRMTEVVARFEREAVAAANIDHPNVAAAFDFGSLEDGTFFLALEYVEGRCLRDEMSGPMEVGRAVHVASQMARALERAHALGIVHRDLKPENIMLVERNGDPDFVKVLDFGIARMRMGEDEGTGGKAALTRAGMVYGTPEYMAPEQALGLPVDARADLYALGIITFEMLAGVRPFEAENTVILLGMHVTAAFPRFVDRAPHVEVPEFLEEVVYRLTAKSADARYGSAREVLDVLEGLEEASQDPGSARVRLNVSQNRTSSPGTRSSPPPPVDTTGRTMFTASGEATDTRFLLSTIRKILQRTWLEVQPLFHALWLKLPEKYRTRRVVLSALGGLGVFWLAVILWVSLSGDGSPTVAESAAVTSKTEPTEQVDEQIAFERTREVVRQGNLDEARALVEAGHFTPMQEAELRQGLVRGFFRAGRRIDAFRQLEALYNTNPDATEIAEVAVDVEKALVAPDSSALAFNYFESHPSHLGADVLYKIVAEAKAGKTIVDRATKALANNSVRQHASQAVLVAADLRAAGRTCKVAVLLPRAKDLGDQRSLAYLYSVVAPAFVTKKKFIFKNESVDQLSCLHKDESLNEAIVAIEKRTNTPHREAAPEQ